MDKRKIFVNATVSLVAFFALLLGAVSRGGSNIFVARGEYEPYSIVLNTTKNKIGEGAFSPTTTHSGNGFASTELGNQVAFEYNQLYNPTNYWQTIKAGGYITNTQPITGMTGMTLTKNSSAADFKIYWSNTTTFTEDKSVLFDTSSGMTVSTNFNGYLPNYIKIYANVNSAIKDGVIEFSCSNNYPSLSLSTNSSTMGSATGAGLYAVGQSVTINATANTGYYFTGWYEGETLVSSNSAYTFTMPFTNLSYVAKFSTNSYVLTLSSNDINKGTVSGGGTYAYGAEVTATATEIAGHEFIGWYQGATLKSTSSVYTFTMPYNALSLEARFVTQYTVNISSLDVSLGTVSGGGLHGYSTSVTVTATTTSGNWFVAWYDDSLNVVSSTSIYTFTMPANDVTYYAEFTSVQPPIIGSSYTFGTYPQSKVTDSILISNLNYKVGTRPTSSSAQAWTDYGYFNSGAVSSYMWYIDLFYDATEYRGVYFTKWRPKDMLKDGSLANNSFQDDNGYSHSTVYWFKFDPIRWRVLDAQSGKAFLKAEFVLDSQDYHYSTSSRTIDGSTVYASNYKDSHIRSWLNDSFYNRAFSTEEKARIQTTMVDNSVASTGYNPNSYACANTNDKVFLLSYVQATSSSYGLDTGTSRLLYPTGYAKSQGVYDSNNFSYWWLRSPYNLNAFSARIVGSAGGVGPTSVDSTSFGVVPALWIVL